ncbi:peroxiredoxin family protein [uncultured Draconibacterium sp.]|uniref:peroxiredoxin family protein n=1 Tax=uncultured Draconibacterium sp. TaxID=1573823 RepID=UPI0025D0EC18|nr:peroxiredoxin family protein [uncultured Draconibacterium sp.]
MKGFVVVLLVLIFGIAQAQNFEHLAVGNEAIDFSLKTMEGREVQLSNLYEDNLVVLVVLRGFPEYQCPICSRQVGSLLAEAEGFSEAGATVLMVYPGKANNLDEHADEFTTDFDFPENFHFTTDPDYSMINKYGLRWDAPKEISYPSTFVIDNNGIIKYSKISTKHGGRAKTRDVLEVLKNL